MFTELTNATLLTGSLVTGQATRSQIRNQNQKRSSHQKMGLILHYIKDLDSALEYRYAVVIVALFSSKVSTALSSQPSTKKTIKCCKRSATITMTYPIP